ncbi:phosphonate ABC transporter ATP-binding protein [Tuberibacillus sp. Marseille-P3662]|uniref:phosphonate ABC transporter ATP-binding protein n=1 Tax=Tuberibacillus sp. Marseille-P3662 TaxID=1965358 RepID=UPI000A1C867E|nr:phosphonate ABC transporter ATP-binding protein [Tuberibacillus sp. Marseille-P3662]
MIEMNNMSVRYPGSHQYALRAINLSLKKGDFVCILGQSGAGKSTLIRCINGLQAPTDGQVNWDGQPLSNMKDEQLRKVRREMGMIFQHFNLVPRLTVLQNVLTGMFGYRNTFKNLLGWYTAEEKGLAKHVITDVGLTELMHRRVESLSGGQKQRVGIARAVLQNPEVLLGDEPVSSLDPGTSNHIFTLLKEMHQRHQLLTVINVHDVTLAKRYATRLIALKDGEMIYDGDPGGFTEQEYHETYESTS